MRDKYGKVLCTLCSTNFCIGRVRTPDEPESAGWHYCGPDELFPDGQHQLWPCSTKETGCLYYFRDDPLNCRFYDEADPPYSAAYSYCVWAKPTFPVKGDWLPIDPDVEPEAGRLCICLEDAEHVAGPGCRYPEAYVGNRISLKEMQGCQTVQWLVPKQDDWESASDDYELEQESSHFLSGIHNGAMARAHRVSVNPVRHGVDEMGLRCPAIDEPFAIDLHGIPFHPWCFGTWMKLTRLRLSFVPINELVDFLRLRDEPVFQPLLQHFWNADRKWIHNPGEEWMAANPFYVPRLRDLVEEAADVSSSFCPHDSAFQHRGSVAPSDVFARLPSEVRHLILPSLSSHDVASLRQASRTFQHLPVSFWRQRLEWDMPWLWEIWRESDPPYFWATVTEEDIRSHETKGFDTVDPEYDDREVRLVTSYTMDVEQHLAQWTYPRPPLHKTILYCGIKRNWKDLKGLRNRKRIWEFQTRLLGLMKLD